MKKLFLVSFLGMLSAIGFAQQAIDNQNISKTANAFFESLNRYDFSDMAAYSTDDFSFVISPGILWKGRTQVQSQHQQAHKGIMKNTSFTPESQTLTTRFITPDVAIVNMVAKMGAF